MQTVREIRPDLASTNKKTGYLTEVDERTVAHQCKDLGDDDEANREGREAPEIC